MKGWYGRAMEDAKRVYALRKHNLNVDLHIHAMEDPYSGGDSPPQMQQGYMRSICGSAVLKGLDVIGIVARESFAPGNICKQVAAQNQYDLAILSGIELLSEDDIHTVVYDAKTIPQEGEPIEQICQRAHNEGGFVMVIQPSKRNMQHLNKIAGQPNAPDFIEVFNDMSKSGYTKTFRDIDAAEEFQVVMNSAATSPQELDKSVMMTRIPRDKLSALGVLHEEQGVNYTPPYLEKVKRNRQGYSQQLGQPGQPGMTGGF